MFVILHGLGMFVADMFKSRRRLEAENLFLRHQLNIALRRAPPRLRLHGSDRALLVWITRIWPNLLDLSQVVKPETILRWHRAGFKAFWRWKSRHRAGRPKIDRDGDPENVERIKVDADAEKHGEHIDDKRLRQGPHASRQRFPQHQRRTRRGTDEIALQHSEIANLRKPCRHAHGMPRKIGLRGRP